MTATASDSCGSITNCSFDVTVALPPLSVNCPSNLTVMATSSNGAVVFFTCSASGGCAPPPYLFANPPSGSLFPLGTTTVTATASDSCGSITNCSFSVTVALPPLNVTCSSNLTVTTTSTNGAVVYFTCSASGGCAPPPYLMADPPSGSLFPLGTTTVTATASDPCGSITNCSFNVTVVLSGPPLSVRFRPLTSLLEVAWAEQDLPPGPPTNGPSFGLESLAAAGLIGSPGWGAFTNGPLRQINNTFLAKNLLGAGAFYRLNSGVTNPGFIPSAATLAATLVNTNSATLNGTATPVFDNTLYWFEYGSDLSYGLATLTNTLSASTNPTSLSGTITGLEPLAAYHFQLVVSDPDGVQYGSDQSFTAKGLPPVAVTLRAAYDIPCEDCAEEVVLNGTVNGNISLIAGYFQYGLTTNYTAQTPQFYGQANSTTQSFSSTLPITALLSNTTYHYRIVAFNLYGEAVGEDVTFVSPQ